MGFRIEFSLDKSSCSALSKAIPQRKRHLDSTGAFWSTTHWKILQRSKALSSDVKSAILRTSSLEKNTTCHQGKIGINLLANHRWWGPKPFFGRGFMVCFPVPMSFPPPLFFSELSRFACFRPWLHVFARFGSVWAVCSCPSSSTVFCILGTPCFLQDKALLRCRNPGPFLGTE